jgi:hypothetical protein
MVKRVLLPKPGFSLNIRRQAVLWTDHQSRQVHSLLLREIKKGTIHINTSPQGLALIISSVSWFKPTREGEFNPRHDI